MRRPRPLRYGGQRLCSFSERFDLNQAIIERRPASHIGKRIAAGQFVGILAVPGQLFPPNRQAHDDSAAGTIGDARAQLKTAAVIEDAHVIPRDHAALRVSSTGAM